jgi:two-component system CheB/CheR fusion protein
VERALAQYLRHAPVFVHTLDGRIIHWTDGASELFGYSDAEAIGGVCHDLLKTTFPAPIEEITAVLSKTGYWQGVVCHTCKNGHSIWAESQCRLADGPRGPAVVEVSTDVSHREILSRELAHRVKNTLAIVQGLARFSFAEAERDGVRRFEDRLKALSEANDLLVRHHWISAGLDELIGCIVRRFHVEGRVERSGPGVTLTPSSVIAYGLAFHELTTNAVKYGALSVPTGKVEVRWEVTGDGEERLHLVWRERDGPPVVAPPRPGFGSRLIERAVANELGGPTRLRFERDGVVCEFEGPTGKHPTAPITPGALRPMQRAG